jgi:hypothetical protein
MDATDQAPIRQLRAKPKNKTAFYMALQIVAAGVAAYNPIQKLIYSFFPLPNPQIAIK